MVRIAARPNRLLDFSSLSLQMKRPFLPIHKKEKVEVEVEIDVSSKFRQCRMLNNNNVRKENKKRDHSSVVQH